MLRAALCYTLVLILPAFARAEADLSADFTLHDDQLKLNIFDTHETESFASILCDAKQHIFVGGREAVFVYEHDGYQNTHRPMLLHRFGKDQWALGLAIRGNDLYVSTHRAIYRLIDAVWKREDITVEPILQVLHQGTGGGFHQGLHDLQWGPTGQLYFALGDLGWYFGDFDRPDHWVNVQFNIASQPDPLSVTLSGGGFFRCDPDGSNLDLIATGIRNPCGMALSPTHELFTTDNDHEQNENYIPSRLLHVVPHANLNWPRSWMHARPDTWSAMAGMGRDVPIGMTYYSHREFGKEYQDNLLLCRWGQRAITRYTLNATATGYIAKEHPFIATLNDARPVDVTVAPNGKVYAAICWMAKNEASPVYKSAVIEIESTRLGSHHYIAFDPTEASTEALAKSLQHQSFTLRKIVHQELIRRGPDACDRAISQYTMKEVPARAWPHILALAAHAHTDAARLFFLNALAHHEPDVRSLALRILESQPDMIDQPRLLELVQDDHPYVRRAAITLLHHQDDLTPFMPALIQVVADSAEDDTQLRLIVAWLWADKINDASLFQLLRHEQPAIRLTAVLATGTRLTMPTWNNPLPSSLLLSPSIAEDVPADQKPMIGLFVASAWHHSLGATPLRTQSLQSLIHCATQEAVPAIQLQALRYLVLLNDPACLTLFESLTRADDNAIRETAASGLIGIASTRSLSMLIDSVIRNDRLTEKLRTEAVQQLNDILTLRKIVLGTAYPSSLRAKALQRLHSLHDKGLPMVVTMLVYAPDSLLAKAVQAITGQTTPTGDPLEQSRTLADHFKDKDWNQLWKKGNPAKGKRLFDRAGLNGVSCRTCHRHDNQGGNFAPSLDDAHARLQPDYLTTAILFPDRDIVPEFSTTRITLLGGISENGVIIGEDSNHITLAKTDGTTEKLPQQRIDWRTPDNHSIMPAGLVHTPDELRDLIAFLMTPTTPQTP